MKTLSLLILAVTLSGCATVVSWIPSFWDANQSRKIVDIAVSAERIDCSQPQLPQAQALVDDLQWFIVYSQSRGPRHRDVIRLVEPMQETAEDWRLRAGSERGASVGYCEIKRELLIEQSTRAARAVQARF